MEWREESEPRFCRLNERKNINVLHFKNFFLFYVKRHTSVNVLAKKIISTWKCYNDQYFNYQTLLNYETDNYRGEIIDN